MLIVPRELLVQARDHERGYVQCIARTAHHDALLLEQDVVTAPVIVGGQSPQQASGLL